MIKVWTKTGVNVKLVGPEHEKGIRRGFANTTEEVSVEQISGLARVLETISNDKFVEASITTTRKVSQGN
ncbi:hypothetical protein ABVF11_07200 [Pediococcus argentinicus]|uniref:hypothetical protein n=1 Tax=Pediococcus argentinicus TaxID=480391 RepID=UPI00338DB5B7